MKLRGRVFSGPKAGYSFSSPMANPSIYTITVKFASTVYTAAENLFLIEKIIKINLTSTQIF